MINVDNIETSGWAAAFRGMRNPMNSWDKSDSFFGIIGVDYFDEMVKEIINEILPYDSNRDEKYDEMFDYQYDEMLKHYNKNGILDYPNISECVVDVALLGPADLKLAQRLILSGTDDSKFMRMINVSMDIEAPLYWWKEMDTYKVGTVANSCSTMHKLASTPITRECFSFDNDLPESDEWFEHFNALVKTCERLRQHYLETKDSNYWRALIQLLPSSWNQKRTWTANYQVLRNIYFARRNHKLQEWKDFCKMIEELPWGKELITIEKREGK